MSRISRLTSEVPQASTASCLHCGASSPTPFCCTGCEAAHHVIAGLGLDAFYRRRETTPGDLRPVEAPSVTLTPESLPDGTHRLDLILGGLTCGACVWLVEQALAAEPDILAARASLTARRLTLRWRGDAARADDYAHLLARLGFRVAPWSPACLRVAEDSEGRALTRALGIAAFGSMNVMLVSVAVWVGTDMGAATRSAMHWLAMLIALPVVLVAGLPFYRPALDGLRAGRLTMDLAISLGVLATTAMSVSETLRNGPYTWFDGATALLALLLAGRVLNHAGRRRARQAGAELIAWQSAPVTRLAADGTTQLAAPETLAPGDRLLLAAGERLALDATADTPALLDTSPISGESLPRRFLPGDALPAGAINMGAPITATVATRLAEGSLAQMARLLEQAEQTKSHLTTLADRAARLYLPAAHAIALATFLGWGFFGAEGWQAALVPAVAALIVTCPCGLAIAVPAVQVVAAGALFRRGLLLGRPDALERLATATRLVLDKTGTLTQGHPTLLPGGFTPEGLRLAASLGAASRHPLARALHRACPEAPFAEGSIEHPGQGLEKGATRLGSAAFTGAPAGAGQGAALTLHLTRPGHLSETFTFADALRPDAPAALARLQALGLDAEILSGDTETATAATAAALGIARFRAAQSPTDKAARIAALQASGARVLMIGDGANDALALASAHAAATPAGATDLAQSSADLILRAEGLTPVAEAIAIARRAQRIARQNIAASLAYNIIAVPLAVAGLVTPLLAAAVMASSSLIVILNALRAGGDPWKA